MDITGLVPRGLGKQGVDHADHRRAVLGVEQVGDLGHVLHQAVKVDLVFRRSHHGGGAARIGISTGEEAIEFVVAYLLEVGLAELAPYFADGPTGGGGADGEQHAVGAGAQEDALGFGPGVGQQTHTPLPQEYRFGPA
ncbi:hypothetical protein FX984_03900 [Pseudomonas marginalis]|nr:hypothetical protein FX984_03900 [Pseudomonas marginalis]